MARSGHLGCLSEAVNARMQAEVISNPPSTRSGCHGVGLAWCTVPVAFRKRADLTTFTALAEAISDRLIPFDRKSRQQAAFG
jgi:hypothetical protein